jgi:trans-aconitate methyltransferase
MLERARADHATLKSSSPISYVEATFDAFQISEPVDLIFSNSALQWVGAEAHEALLPKLMSFLKPGGVLAIQLPDTRALPGCQLIVEAAKQLGWQDEVSDVRWVTCEKDTGFYYELLAHAGAEIQDIWTTTYAQIMDGENPVADFLSSTALGPYLEALGGRGSPRGLQLEAKYRELVTEAYAKQSDGRTIFDMTRIFLIATKPRA